MEAVYTDLLLVALGAMLSPTTLIFSVFALILGEHPRRTGFWFLLGAFLATLAVGVLAAFVIGDVASSPNPSTPKTWVAVLDLAFGLLVAAYAVKLLRSPPPQKTVDAAIERMSKVASSPWVAVVAAGAMLANPGGFIPIALKDISETKPDATQYILLWLAFTVVALLPLIVAVIALGVSQERTMTVLHAVRGWLERNANVVLAVILFLLAVSLLRSAIAGLTA